jgi:hypothetical protein
VREAVLTNLWLTALTQLQPTGPEEGKPCWLPDCLLDQGRNVAEYLAVLPSRDARCDCRSAEALCDGCGWTRRLTARVGVALMHTAARLRVIPWKLACTACCTARL